MRKDIEIQQALSRKVEHMKANYMRRLPVIDMMEPGTEYCVGKLVKHKNIINSTLEQIGAKEYRAELAENKGVIKRVDIVKQAKK